MRLKSLFSLCLVLSACEVSRPEGAYWPEAAVPGERPVGFEDEDAGEEPDPGPDEDSGAAVEPEPDAGDDAMVVVDPNNPLSALQGTYLMRMDYYSTATGSDSGSTLVLDNRISNLFFTELKLNENGELVATEKLCFQDYENKCVRGCQANTLWTTKVDSGLTPFLQKRVVTRTYKRSGGSLVADPAQLALGYDPPSATSKVVPSDASEANVWVIDASNPDRRGVHTYVEAQVLVAGAIPVALKCHVDSAQLFVTQFSAQLANLDAASLSALRITLNAEDSDAVPLYANGDPKQVCDKSKLGGGAASKQEQFVRFKQVDALKACPKNVAAFDATLPPDHRLQ